MGSAGFVEHPTISDPQQPGWGSILPAPAP